MIYEWLKIIFRMVIVVLQNTISTFLFVFKQTADLFNLVSLSSSPVLLSCGIVILSLVLFGLYKFGYASIKTVISLLIIILAAALILAAVFLCF